MLGIVVGDQHMPGSRLQEVGGGGEHCPQCGGVMEFDPATGGMKCPYCEYAEEIAAGEAAMKAARLRIRAGRSIMSGILGVVGITGPGCD